MLRSLFSGISGLRSHQTMLDVTGNNIANVNTTGFKASQVQFQDTLSQVLTNAGGAQDGVGGTNPAQVGLGVRVAGITTSFTQGASQTTGRSTDMMIQGDGFFVVRKGAETFYTRAGSFNTNATGQLVTVDGFNVIPAITVPPDALDVVVNKTGQVFARIDGQAELQELGQLTLASFANEAGLAPLGDNLFQETAASGAANVGVPGDPGFATIEQGYLENSNVDPVKEITELISAQRAYEMNSKVIQAADEMAAVVSKNIR